ncbi:UNVERIFIED_CONTAM: hypothetical protein Slati_4425100 [Sesamum latifolium]|uniref:Uncharacterized protein n=1 Tax=Sesamum latifolium TaxID=2727402 RepID=A0AAW2SQ67_9LAMI
MQHPSWGGVYDTRSSNALWQFMQTSYITLDCGIILPFPFPSSSEAIGALKAFTAVVSASSFFLIQHPAPLPFAS